MLNSSGLFSEGRMVHGMEGSGGICSLFLGGIALGSWRYEGGRHTQYYRNRYEGQYMRYELHAWGPSASSIHRNA